MLFYGGTVLVISLLVTTMCAYVARRRRLLAEGVSIAELRGLNSRTRPTATFYGGILLLAVLAPRGGGLGLSRGLVPRRESPPPTVEAVGLFRRRPRNPVVHVGDPRFDDWEVVADYEDLETARAFRDRLREFGFGAELTADEALDEFRRGRHRVEGAARGIRGCDGGA